MPNMGGSNRAVTDIRDNVGRIVDEVAYLQRSGELTRLQFKLDKYQSGAALLQLNTLDGQEEGLKVDSGNVIGYLYSDPPSDCFALGDAETLAADLAQIVHRTYNVLSTAHIQRIGVVFEWTHELGEGESANTWINDRFIHYPIPVEGEIDLATISLAYTSELATDAEHKGTRRSIINIAHPDEMDESAFLCSLDFQRYFEPAFEVRKRDNLAEILREEAASALRSLDAEAQKIFSEVAVR